MLRLRSLSIATRIVIALAILFFGGITYRIVSFLMYGIDYNTRDYQALLLREWLPIGEPIFFSLMPAFFLALRIIFLRTSSYKIICCVLSVSLMITLPPYLHNLKLWQPLVQTIKGLPLTEVRYERYRGIFIDGRSDSMEITFVIPHHEFDRIERMIETRLTQYNGAALRTDNDSVMNDQTSLETEYEYLYTYNKRSPERIEARIYRIKF